MFIDQLLYPVEALGPGKRIGIWLVGCNRACPGCSNPELWSTEGRQDISVTLLVRSIQAICAENQVDGFTISGGEPMLQATELVKLVSYLSQLSKDILVFSGFTYEEILQNRNMSDVLEHIAVLVDGPYLQSQNEQLVLRGSSNQRILLFEPEMEGIYTKYLEAPQSGIQNLHFSDETISIGIHEKSFTEKINKKLQEHGIRSVDNG